MNTQQRNMKWYNYILLTVFNVLICITIKGHAYGAPTLEHSIFSLTFHARVQKGCNRILLICDISYLNFTLIQIPFRPKASDEQG